MDKELEFYTADLVRDSQNFDFIEVDILTNLWGFSPPKDYLDFMSEIADAEGPIGENSWLTLWKMSDLVVINAKTYIMRQIPDYFIFGKDVADTGYAFNKKNACIYDFGLMSNFKTDPIKYRGGTFLEFIRYLYNK